MVRRGDAWGVSPDAGSEPIVLLTCKKLAKKWLRWATGKRYARVDKLREKNKRNKELI